MSDFPITRPKVTTGPIANGPPSGPIDGDTWIAVVDNTGVRWQFQYNAGSSSAYKWEYIGGTPQVGVISAVDNTNSTTYVDSTGPSFTIARAGDYWVEIDGMAGSNNAAGDILWWIANIGASSVEVSASASGNTSNNANDKSMRKKALLTGLTAGVTAKIQYKVGGSFFMYMKDRTLSVTPVRIS